LISAALRKGREGALLTPTEALEVESTDPVRGSSLGEATGSRPGSTSLISLTPVGASGEDIVRVKPGADEFCLGNGTPGVDGAGSLWLCSGKWPF
jgi:hypothetical protein